MPFNMINRDQRELPRDRERLCRFDADPQRCGQPGTAGNGNAINTIFLPTGKRLKQLGQYGHMHPRGHLRHDTTKKTMLLNLGRHHVFDHTKSLAIAFHDRHCRLVTTGFYRQNPHAR